MNTLQRCKLSMMSMDLDVENLTVRLDRVTSSAPEIDFRRILKGRESKPCFFDSWDDADRKGEKVCRI